MSPSATPNARASVAATTAPPFNGGYGLSRTSRLTRTLLRRSASVCLLFNELNALPPEAS